MKFIEVHKKEEQSPFLLPLTEIKRIWCEYSRNDFCVFVETESDTYIYVSWYSRIGMHVHYQHLKEQLCIPDVSADDLKQVELREEKIILDVIQKSGVKGITVDAITDKLKNHLAPGSPGDIVQKLYEKDKIVELNGDEVFEKFDEGHGVDGKIADEHIRYTVKDNPKNENEH